MLKTRLIILGICAVAIWLLYQLPKSVVDSESALGDTQVDTVSSHIQQHAEATPEVRSTISELRALFAAASGNEKSAIFADSLATLYGIANHYDSAAWFADEASKFFNNTEGWIKAGDFYYQAYTLAIDQKRQDGLAAKAREFYGKVLEKEPENLTVKTNLAMTFLTSSNPMQGITMLRDVLAMDPGNELALFNMGMLSIQSAQYDRAIERLEKLIEINPAHVQAQLLLGIAWMNQGNKEKARQQFEKVKKLDNDPAVQATVDSYLNDLK